MKKKKFIVDFGDDKIQVRAYNRKEAKILAKAKRINQGREYNITEVIDVSNNSVYRVV